MLGNSERLAASQEGLSSMQLILFNTAAISVMLLSVNFTSFYYAPVSRVAHSVLSRD
jgi:hypothetical protein